MLGSLGPYISLKEKEDNDREDNNDKNKAIHKLLAKN